MINRCGVSTDTQLIVRREYEANLFSVVKHHFGELCQDLARYFKGECDAMVDVTLIRSLNKGQVIHLGIN